MADKVFFGAIHIIEWFGANERVHTAWDLFNELEPIGIVYKPQLPVYFHRVNSRAQFGTALDIVTSESIGTQRIPMLHIETHGTADGIGPQGEDGMAWPELTERLIALNALTRLNLFVAMASCEGAWAIKMLQPIGRSAYFGLLGPNKEINEETLAKGFMAFYKAMLAHRSIDAGFRAMKDAVLPARKVFSLISAQMAFEMVLAEYRDTQHADDAVEARLDRIEADGAAQGMTEQQRRNAREMARDYLKNSREYFDKARREFFFIDKFPEHEERFPLRLAECRTVEQMMAKD